MAREVARGIIPSIFVEQNNAQLVARTFKTEKSSPSVIEREWVITDVRCTELYLFIYNATVASLCEVE